MLVLLLVSGVLYLGWDRFRAFEAEHPEYFPWTPLSLGDPVGAFTDDKLAALADDAPHCRSLLAKARTGDRPAPPRRLSEPACGYEDGIEIGSAEGTRLAYGRLVTSCPVAAALALWERETLQPAAQKHFGERVVAIDHFGSFSCRRLYGRDEGPFSEHATADAVDIAGFRMESGATIPIVRDWPGDGREARFLREVRDGACDLFRTVLSPDYNEAHADHFHFDMAAGRPAGWSMCR
ncbi:extensin-like domain-containing protein [Sphingomicrobium lutaoense]|uniref:Extensin-like C-terminal domain-containing protein n=1 Tax=Sphingomicrobium lutaoense TaxID=515949 RepID=A0A839Z3J1_9SPHN|nr:extensin family protein [Sphingomicrobium lutaoense]MBB3764135.1 hypothetical protein [Sphingomicrobium lutaoense]